MECYILTKLKILENELKAKNKGNNMKAIFMGTPVFALNSLNTLISLGIEIPLVVTKEDARQGRKMKTGESPVKMKAREANIDILQPSSLKDEDVIRIIRDINPDVIVVTAYGKVLPREILDIPKFGCINVHASLLPKYRGASPINSCILDGDTITGITTMYMNGKLDEGYIILQDELTIEPDDDSQTLTEKLAKLSEKTLENTLKMMMMNIEIPRIEQDETKSSYCTLLSKEKGHINYYKTADEIINTIRGLQPWPCAYSFYNENNIKIFKAEKTNEKSVNQPGTIVKSLKDKLIVATSTYDISIKELQLAGKKRMNISDFLRGNKLLEGEILK